MVRGREQLLRDEEGTLVNALATVKAARELELMHFPASSYYVSENGSMDEDVAGPSTAVDKPDRKKTAKTSKVKDSVQRQVFATATVAPSTYMEVDDEPRKMTDLIDLDRDPLPSKGKEKDVETTVTSKSRTTSKSTVEEPYEYMLPSPGDVSDDMSQPVTPDTTKVETRSHEQQSPSGLDELINEASTLEKSIHPRVPYTEAQEEDHQRRRINLNISSDDEDDGHGMGNSRRYRQRERSASVPATTSAPRI